MLMSENDDRPELIEGFDIDNGELEGLTPQECFIIGVEWCQFFFQMLRM